MLSKSHILYNNPLYCDYVLSLKNEEVEGVRIGLQWLAAKSDYFLAILTNNTEENKTKRIEITLPERLHAAFHDMIRFTYVGMFEKEDDFLHLLRLLEVADQFDVKEVSDAVLQTLHRIPLTFDLQDDGSFREALFLVRQFCMDHETIRFHMQNIVLKTAEHDARSYEPLKEPVAGVVDGGSKEKMAIAHVYANRMDSDHKALAWYWIAAYAGSTDAEYVMGTWLLEGRETEKNEAEAVKHFTKAAMQGHAEAQYQLGMCYHLGRGIKQDDSKEFEWFEKAAEQYHVRATFQVGECHRNGRGTQKSESMAIAHYSYAAFHEDANAQYQMVLYARERGFTNEIKRWLNQAAANGHAQAKKELE